MGSAIASRGRTGESGEGTARLPESFDRELLREGLTGLYLSGLDRRVLGGFARTYRRLHPETVDPDPRPRIPRTLHQIWLGGNPLPERFRRFREGWLAAHPDWEHRLWTDAEVAELDFGSRDLFEDTGDVGMRSDLLRAEILLRFGGLYADVDYECLRPLDAFHYRYDFYGTLRAGLGAHVVFPTIYGSPLAVCNSLYAAVPGHPVMEDYLAKVRRLWPRGREIRLGWWRAETWIAGRRRGDLLRAKRTAKLTYLPFSSTATRHVLTQGRGGRAVVMPPSYFNPIDTWWRPKRFLTPTGLRGLFRHAGGGGRGMPPHYRSALPHTFAVHHSSASWI